MKKLLIFSCAATIMAFTACSDNNRTESEELDETASTTTSEINTGGTGASDNYVALGSGNRVRRDAASGHYVDESGNMVDFYVDVNTRDTFYHTGHKVNNAILYRNGTYTLDEAKIKIDGDEMKYKSGDTKIKVDGDEYKRKDGDTKVKVDGDEVKVKED